MEFIKIKFRNGRGRARDTSPCISFFSSGSIMINGLAVELLGGELREHEVYVDFLMDESRPQDRYLQLGSRQNKDSVRFALKRNTQSKQSFYQFSNIEHCRQLAEVLKMALPMKFHIATTPIKDGIFAIITSKNLKAK